MASKPVPAKKNPATSADKSTDPNEASITTIKKSTCKTLQGTATLTYHIGLDDTGATCALPRTGSSSRRIPPRG